MLHQSTTSKSEPLKLNRRQKQLLTLVLAPHHSQMQ
jgi:hypothetical protein